MSNEMKILVQSNSRRIDYSRLVVYRSGVDRYDPTRTTALRNAFAADLQRRFNELKRIIKIAIVDQDCFGLIEDHTFQVFAAKLTPPNHEQFKFSTKEQKVNAFMEWLREQEQKGLLETTTINQVGGAIKKPWTNLYIADSYKRGVIRARYEMNRIGMAVPGIDMTGGIAASMSTPFHMDRVGMMYTRTFEDLKGITAAMDSQISRVLTQGMVDGDGAKVLAKKLTDSISGLGIKNTGTGRITMSPERRAQILARTEIIRAHHSATIQEYRNWGVAGVDVQAEFRTAGDARVCSQCKDLEGRVYTLDAAEGLIPVHPQCRCITIPTMPIEKKSSAEGLWINDGVGQLSEIKRIMEEEAGNYNFFGIRIYGDEKIGEGQIKAPNFKKGQVLPDSYYWVGSEKGGSLGGVSTIGIKSSSVKDIKVTLRHLKNYEGKQVVMVGGKLARKGYDAGEIIIKGGKVLTTWNKL